MSKGFHKIILGAVVYFMLVQSGAGGIVLAIAESAETQPQSSASASRQELQDQIQSKAKELETINQQIESAQQTLKSTQAQKNSLQQAVGSLQGNINQLNLSIKADQIASQKLSLEINSLNYDLQGINSSINDKRNAIAQILKEFQKTENSDQDLLAILLRNNSLADGVFEIQTLSDLQARLTADIPNLRALHDEYNSTLQEANNKRKQVDFHKKNQENKKLIVEDQKEEKNTLLVQTKNQEKIYKQQVSNLVKMQQQIADEIESLDAILRAKIDPSILPAPGRGVLAMPISGGENRVTQDYGATAFAKYGYTGKWHNGIDIGAPIGTPILAAEDGQVAAVGNQDSYCYRGAYGRFIVVNHNNNLTTLYAHLSRTVVQKGDVVKRGDLIGYVGKTGYATGPHLHLTVYAQPTYHLGASKSCGPMPQGGDLNPSSYL